MKKFTSLLKIKVNIEKILPLEVALMYFIFFLKILKLTYVDGISSSVMVRKINIMK